MMIKVNFAGFTRKTNVWKLKFLQLIQDQSIFKDLAKLAADTIYKRVKSGYGVTDDTSESPEKDKLEKLSPSYVAYRKGLIRFWKKDGIIRPWKPFKGAKFRSPVTGEFGTPNKSNLTLTGQLLRAISTSYTKNGFKIFIQATKRDDGLSNDDVAVHVSKRRPFLALTTGEQRIIAQKYQAKIRELARSLQ